MTGYRIAITLAGTLFLGMARANAALQSGSGSPTAFTSAIQPSDVSLSDVNFSSITLVWNANGNPIGTSYLAQISGNSFRNIYASSQTLNTSASFLGLASNATYDLRVEALDNAGTPAAFVSIAATVTPAALPIKFPPNDITRSAITANWGAGGNVPGTIYISQISSGAFPNNFSGNASLMTMNTFAGFFGLTDGTTYYFQVEAKDLSGRLTAFVALPSTMTRLAPLSLASETSGYFSPGLPLQLIFIQSAGPVTATVPADAFSAAVTVTVQTPTIPRACSFPPGSSLTDMGVGAQISVSSGMEPTADVPLSISYVNAPLLVGANRSNLTIARCDADVGVWIPLPSNSETSSSLVSAVTDRFSLFEVMSLTPSLTPSNSVKDVSISNNPIRPSQGFTNATFTNLPANARLKIYTISGLLVKDITADASGVATWDATNQSGRQVASGVYFILAHGDVTTNTFKIAVQR